MKRLLTMIALTAVLAQGQATARRFVPVTDAMLQDFKTLLASRKLKVDEESFAKDDTFIRAMIHFEIDRALFGMEEARRNVIAKDPQAQFALSQFPEAEHLMELASAKSTRNGKGGQ